MRKKRNGGYISKPKTSLLHLSSPVPPRYYGWRGMKYRRSYDSTGDEEGFKRPDSSASSLRAYMQA